MKDINLKDDYEKGKVIAGKICKLDKEEFEIMLNRVAIYDRLIEEVITHPVQKTKKINQLEDNLKIVRLWDLAKFKGEPNDLEAHYRHWLYRVLTVCYNDDIPDEKKATVLAKSFKGASLSVHKGKILAWCQDAIEEVKNILIRIQTANEIKK